MTVSRPSFRAVACASACSAPALGLLGFISNATREILGATCRNRSTRLAPINDVNRLTPVTWPPGRFRLATSPNRTGSAPIVKTTGTLRACGLRCARRRDIASRRDHCHTLCHKLGRECRQRLIVAIGPPFLDADVPALGRSEEHTSELQSHS